jgi:A/G-specific adenine glycosylase
MFRLTSQLLTWYRQNGRSLPWREDPNPYAVWVSEIMLQQTRVDTVIPFFEKWMKLFPTIKHLANASERDVLNAWEGLGYYSRARNLHKASKITIEKYNGHLPHDVDELRKLPGIGSYTAGAITSIAFGMDEPTLDGNIRRVFSRVFDLTEPADSPAGVKLLWGFAAKYLPKGQAGDYNQALMDLGATTCLSRNPRCGICPLTKDCKARKAGTQKQRPILKSRKTVPHYFNAAGVIFKKGRVLMAKRPSKGLLGGMWEFPNGQVDGNPAKGLIKTLEKGYGLKVYRKKPLVVIDHAYSHFRVTVHPFTCELITTDKLRKLRWINVVDLEKYPMGKVDRQIARQVLKALK